MDTDWSTMDDEEYNNNDSFISLTPDKNALTITFNTDNRKSLALKFTNANKLIHLLGIGFFDIFLNKPYKSFIIENSEKPPKKIPSFQEIDDLDSKYNEEKKILLKLLSFNDKDGHYYYQFDHNDIITATINSKGLIQIFGLSNNSYFKNFSNNNKPVYFTRSSISFLIDKKDEIKKFIDENEEILSKNELLTKQQNDIFSNYQKTSHKNYNQKNQNKERNTIGRGRGRGSLSGRGRGRGRGRGHGRGNQQNSRE